MCHSGGSSLLFAILAALSILNCPAAGAQTGTIEQNLTTVPAENLAVSGRAGHFAFISQRRPIRIVKN
jgi:hypothetical protein